MSGLRDGISENCSWRSSRVRFSMRRSRVCRLSLRGCPSTFSSGLNRPSVCGARLSFELLMCTSGAWYEERVVMLHIPVYISGMGKTFFRVKTLYKTNRYDALAAARQNPGRNLPIACRTCCLRRQSQDRDEQF